MTDGKNRINVQKWTMTTKGATTADRSSMKYYEGKCSIVDYNRMFSDKEQMAQDDITRLSKGYVAVHSTTPPSTSQTSPAVLPGSSACFQTHGEEQHPGLLS